MTDQSKSETEELPVTENLTENLRTDLPEETKSEEVHPNWVPPEKRRPEDEFFDLKSMVVVRETDILGDGSITKLVLEEGKGACVDMDDLVYYLHETRFDNGQLVDLQEMRKVPQKFEMKDPYFHDFYRNAILQMRKGEVAFLKLAPAAHHSMFHTCN
jgi:hypothetical protein